MSKTFKLSSFELFEDSIKKVDPYGALISMNNKPYHMTFDVEIASDCLMILEDIKLNGGSTTVYFHNREILIILDSNGTECVSSRVESTPFGWQLIH